MGIDWYTFVVMETENPRKLRDKLIDLNLVDEHRKNIYGSERVVSRIMNPYPGSKDTILYKGIAKVSDLVDRFSISRVSNMDGRIITTLLEVHRDGFEILDRIKTEGFSGRSEFEDVKKGRMSSFQFDYFFNKYDFRLILNHEHSNYNYKEYEDIESIFDRYRENEEIVIDQEDSNLSHEDKRQRLKIDRSDDLTSDYSYSAEMITVKDLLEFFHQKGIMLDSSSIQSNLIMAVSYKPNSANLTTDSERNSLRPVLIPEESIRDNFDDLTVDEYLTDLIRGDSSIPEIFSSKDFFVGNLDDEMNNPPNPENVRDRSIEINLKEKSLGELQTVITVKGKVFLDNISEEFDFILLCSFSWLSENQHEELQKVQDIIEST